MSGVAAVTLEATRPYYNTWPDGRVGGCAVGAGCRCLAESAVSDDERGGAGDADTPAVYQHRCQTCAGADCMHPCRDPGRHHYKLGLPGPPPAPAAGAACCCHQPRSAPAASVVRLDALTIGYDWRTRQLRHPAAVVPAEAPDATAAPTLAGRPAPTDQKTAEEERDSGVGESPSSTLAAGAAAPRLLRRADGSLSSSSSLSTEPGLLWERRGSEAGSSRDLSSAAQHKAAKKRGLSGLFSRGLFSWRSKESQSPGGLSANVPGWRIFNKAVTDDGSASHKLLPTASCTSLTSLASSTGESPSRSGARRPLGLQAGSQGLILEARPPSLPAKSSSEEARHRLEHLALLEEARRKDEKNSKCQKKAMQAQLKTEQSVAQSTKTWNQEILPNWEKLRSSRRVSDLWWAGLPPSVRGRVWKLAIGNDLNITPQLYRVYHDEAMAILRGARPADSPQPAADGARTPASLKQASVDLIRLDVARTFPQLGLFQTGGPYHDLLHQLLGAYVCYRPDVGYIQGMSFIAAVLLLYTDGADAFTCFANLLNRPFLFHFFQLDQTMMTVYYGTYTSLLYDNLPALGAHMEAEGVTPDLYLVDWLYTLFSKSLPLDVACRIWDVFLRDGETFLIRAALGILHLYEEQLRAMEFINMAQFLTGLPDDLNSDALFKSIARVHTSLGKASFHELLQRSGGT